MKTNKLVKVACIIASIVTSIDSLAVPDTKIAIRCPDVVLWWPSTNGQTFLVQSRPDLNTETQWTTLTNFYPAVPNTNLTYFVHSNQVACPQGQSFGMMSASSNLGGVSSAKSYPPALVSAVLAGQESYFLKMPPMPKVRVGNEFVPWEKVHGELRPIAMKISPSIRERILQEYSQVAAELLVLETVSEAIIGETISTPDSFGGENILEPSGSNPDPQGAGDGGGSNVAGMAFYRAINVTPVARANVFGVEQDSFDNYLDVLIDDSEPNDEPILISQVASAQHGSLQYTPDGSVFQYTPDAGFYGVDSFAYTITNRHASWSSAIVTVFVNQTGNSRPTAGQTIITLETNNYTVVLNVLTNAFEPDSDTLTLFSLGTVRLGTLSSNGNGIVTYQRNSNWFGRDDYSFVVTDGRGGHAIGQVVVKQVDSDGDEMPDEYENRSGLDAMSDDSAGDPDSDGLPNLGEYSLQTNPHAFDNPLSLSVTNLTKVNGFAQLPLGKLTPVIRKQPITLYVNDAPAANSFLSQGPDGQWLLNWNTTFLTNGNYSIKAGFQYKSYSAITEINTIFGTSKTIQVTNLISFDGFTSKFADFLLIDAKLAVQSATYRVDLSDEAGNPLVYGIFTTTNGLIQIYWDLTDGNGNQLAFGSVRSDIRIGPPGTTNFSSLDVVPQWFIKETPNTGNGFVVAWGWDVYNTTFSNRREQLMLNGVINLIDEQIIGNGYRLAPAANSALGSAFRYDSEDDKKTLLTALKDSNNGNFFWFGHGSSAGIEGNGDRSFTLAVDVEIALKNFAYKSSPTRLQTNAHPYRLVILNGCETYSPEWANAFGIDFDPRGGYLDTYYNNAGRPQRAFVGWTAQIDVPGYKWYSVGNNHPQYANALGQMFFNWMQGSFLSYSVNQFAVTAEFYGFSNASSNKISGCINMTR